MEPRECNSMRDQVSDRKANPMDYREEDVWTYRECFIPWYCGEHLRVVAKARAD